MFLNIEFLPVLLRESLLELWKQVEVDVDYQRFWVFLFELVLSQPTQLSGKVWTEKVRLALHNSYTKQTAQLEGVLAEKTLLKQLQLRLGASLPQGTSVRMQDISKMGNGGDLMGVFTCPDKHVSRIAIELKRHTSTIGNAGIRTWKEKVDLWEEQYGKIDVAILCSIGPIAEKENQITYEEGKRNHLYIASVPERSRLAILSLFCTLYYRQVYPSKVATPFSLTEPLAQLNDHLAAVSRVIGIKRKLQEQLNLLDVETKRMSIQTEDLIHGLKCAQTYHTEYQSGEDLAHAFHCFLTKAEVPQLGVKRKTQ